MCIMFFSRFSTDGRENDKSTRSGFFEQDERRKKRIKIKYYKTVQGGRWGWFAVDKSSVRFSGRVKVTRKTQIIDKLLPRTNSAAHIL